MEHLSHHPWRLFRDIWQWEWHALLIWGIVAAVAMPLWPRRTTGFCPKDSSDFANPGHLSPYLAESELPLQSALPLGLNDQELDDDREYEVALQQQLMFGSNGVVEACNSQGELYGFDRALKVSGQSAYVVAEAANILDNMSTSQ